MTHFVLTREFRAASLEVYWQCYFDPGHNAEMDRRTDIARRVILAEHDDGQVLRRTVELAPRRSFPAWLQKIVRGDLSYLEKSAFHRADHRIEYEIVPSLLRDRIKLHATYRMQPAGAGKLLRTYTGDVTVNLPLIGRRIERAIIAEMSASFDRAAEVTQEWLDRAAHDHAPSR